MSVLGNFFKGLKKNEATQDSQNKVESTTENQQISQPHVDVIVSESKPEQPKIKTWFEICTEKNPAFAGMDISKIEFLPIDNDVRRMGMYGLYKGDKISGFVWVTEAALLYLESKS